VTVIRQLAVLLGLSLGAPVRKRRQAQALAKAVLYSVQKVKLGSQNGDGGLDVLITDVFHELLTGGENESAPVPVAWIET
jgi:hypothetical protein